MIRINVAPEIRYKSNSAELVRVALVVLVVCGIGYYIPIYYAGLREQETTELRTRIEEKQAQLGKLKVDVEKVKALQQRLGEVKSRAERIRSLSAGRKQPVLLLDTLQNQHLERMWFTSLSLKGDDVHVQGFALDHVVIAEYVRRLKVNVGGNAEGEAGDLKDFVPPFMREGDAATKDAVGGSESVRPLKIGNVRLNGSKADTRENVLVQSFDVNFTTNAR
jgi:Tfp pilus assembly protein PilN